MKTLILTLLTALTTNAFANVSLLKYENDAKTIVQLEKDNQFLQASVIAALSAQHLADDLKIDQVVSNIKLKMTEHQEEQVTARHSRSSSSSEILHVFGNIFALFTFSESSSWVDTKMVTTNATEVSGFSELIQANRSQLNLSLANYFKQNESAIVFMKAFAAKSLSLALNLTSTERNQIIELISRSAQRVTQISFVGQLDLDRCLEVQHAEKTSISQSSLSLFGISIPLSSESHDVTNPAYSETTCSLNTVSMMLTEGQDFISSRLLLADLTLQSFQKRLGLKQVTDSIKSEFPTWGSSHYK